MRLDWNHLHCKWTSSLGGVVKQPLYTSRPIINCKYTEPMLSGVIQPMVLHCEEDIASLDQWFATSSKLVRCPIFYRAPVIFNGSESYYDDVRKCIRWVDSIISFTGGYYTGSNADSNYNVINPNLPVEWLVDIVPDERGYRYTQASLGQGREIEAIGFKVLARSY